jgi:ferric-dicitrate binding protein FerR (iron transport regulator)
MTKQEAQELLSKYEQGICSAEEVAWIETWYINFNESKELDLRIEDLDGAETRMMRALSIYESRTFPLWKKVTVAASILLVSVLGYYTLQRNTSLLGDATDSIANTKIHPGVNKAVLILADGSEIDLEEAANGKLDEVPDVTIIKKASGEIIYQVKNAKNEIAGQQRYHTIATPRGGTYQVLLEDGSRIWLNAASSIKFPTSFLPDERIVELKGEAYFEIAKNSKRPFTVRLDGQSVQVLGTKFNVNSYPDESRVATTLLEGSVKVVNQVTNVILKPGEQSQSTNSKVEVEEVNTGDFLAWKNGMFSFHRADLRTVLRQFERWYNIDVKFESDVPDIFFTGKIYRNLNLDDALNNLTFLGVKFKIENQKVTVLSE